MANNVDPAIQQLIETAETTDDPLAFLMYNFVERYSPIQLIIMDRHPAFYPVFEAALDRMIELGRREEWMDYLLAKGIKIHGGINEYVNYFFDVGMNPIDRVLSLPESDRKDMLTLSVTIELQKMLLKPELTAENRVRVQAAIDRLNPPIPGAAAPAAGGARRREHPRRHLAGGHRARSHQAARGALPRRGAESH
jgi:hypothetical protein